MSPLKKQLLKLIPRFGSEANKIRNVEARSRWMKIKKVTESPKSLAAACRFFGISEDAYSKWGSRLLKQPRAETLNSRSRKPHRSPNKTKPSNAKKVIRLRRYDPSIGPERLSDELKRTFNTDVAPSTIYAILKREKMISQAKAKKLTKKHLKRYRRPFPGFLQMDFKYVPYLVEGKQFYQLSCVDHHSSWRLIRVYRTKDLDNVMLFLGELIRLCPFPIIEIQTDNDTAFTDRFSSRCGVTGEHKVDIWCKLQGIIHRL